MGTSTDRWPDQPHGNLFRRVQEGPWAPARGAGGADRRERVQQVAGRVRQPVEPRHHHHVAGGEVIEQPAKLHPVGLGPARHFPEYLLGSFGAKLAHLRINALPVRRYSRVG
jgi:hypothetical protein